MSTQPNQPRGDDREYDQRPAPVREKPEYAKLVEQFTDYTPEDLEIIWERNDELLTVGDFRFFLYYCKQHKVDPVVGECVASYRWNSIKGKKVLTPIVTVGVLRKRRAPECDGLDQFTFAYEGKVLVSASGSIYRKNCAKPFSTTVFYKEYASTTRTGTITTMWREKSHMMLGKCLEAQLTRLGFYDVCGELLIDEETQSRGQVEDPEAQAAATAAGPSPVGVKAEPAAPTPAAPAPEPEPEPEPEPVAPKTFQERSAALAKKIGGAEKVALGMLASYFRGFLDVKRLSKDVALYTVPLDKLEPVIDQDMGTFMADPEGFGMRLAGRPRDKKSMAEAEMEKLGWPEDIRGLAKDLMKALEHTDQDFITWLNNIAPLKTMSHDDLRIFLPLFGVVRGSALDLVDWAETQKKTLAEALEECKVPEQGTPEAIRQAIADLVGDSGVLGV